jgi:hypothetical protein
VVLVSYVTNRLPVGSLTALNCRASHCRQWEYSHSENPFYRYMEKEMNMNRLVLRALAVNAVALLAVFSAPAYAGGSHRFVVFGDSLSNPGNFFIEYGQVSKAPYQPVPSSPYDIHGHHFSNGPTWIEQLADELPSYRPASTGRKSPRRVIGSVSHLDSIIEPIWRSPGNFECALGGDRTHLKFCASFSRYAFSVELRGIARICILLNSCLLIDFLQLNLRRRHRIYPSAQKLQSPPQERRTPR